MWSETGEPVEVRRRRLNEFLWEKQEILKGLQMFPQSIKGHL